MGDGFGRGLSSGGFTMTHYGRSMQPDRLLAWAEEMVHQLASPRYRVEPSLGPVAPNETASAMSLRPSMEVPIFCYSGMSGVAHATALSMAWLRRYGPTFGMVYVRKRSESHDTHGKPVEYSIGQVQHCLARLVFVDDTVCSGRTLEYTMRNAHRAMRDQCMVQWDSTAFILALSEAMCLQTRPFGEMLDDERERRMRDACQYAMVDPRGLSADVRGGGPDLGGLGASVTDDGPAQAGPPSVPF